MGPIDLDGSLGVTVMFVNGLDVRLEVASRFAKSYMANMRSDISADGRRFPLVKEDAPESLSRDEVTVVLNWSDELKRLVEPALRRE